MKYKEVQDDNVIQVNEARHKMKNLIPKNLPTDLGWWRRCEIYSWQILGNLERIAFEVETQSIPVGRTQDKKNNDKQKGLKRGGKDEAEKKYGRFKNNADKNV